MTEKLIQFIKYIHHSLAPIKKLKIIKNLFSKKIFMEKILRENNFDYLNPVMAGTVIFVKVNQNSQKFRELLLKKYNIGVIPGILFGKKWLQWLRLGFGAVSDEEIIKGIKIISTMRPSLR